MRVIVSFHARETPRPRVRRDKPNNRSSVRPFLEREEQAARDRSLERNLAGDFGGASKADNSRIGEMGETRNRAYVSQHPMFDLHWLAPAGLHNAARNCRPYRNGISTTSGHGTRSDDISWLE